MRCGGEDLLKRLPEAERAIAGGQLRTIRRLLILSASTVVQWASRRGAAPRSWLAQMLPRKPRMLVTVALANKTARIVWARLVKGGTYRAPAVAA